MDNKVCSAVWVVENVMENILLLIKSSIMLDVGLESLRKVKLMMMVYQQPWPRPLARLIPHCTPGNTSEAQRPH